MGLATIATSLLFIVAAIYEVVAGTANDPGISIGLAVFFGVTALAGVAATYFGFRPSYNKSSDPREIEQNLLGIARDLNGEITIEELALHTPLTVSECKALLERMVTDGAAELGFGPHQENIYVFRGFLKNGKRTRSYDPFTEDETVLDLRGKSDEVQPASAESSATAPANQTEPHEQ